LFYNLNQQNIREKAALAMTGASGHKRVPISFYENLTIPLPPLEIQEKIVQNIELVEQQIDFLNLKLELLEKEKEKILQKYLFS
ncbi:restriction endonuclease subunit S, partial [Campylobacter coli]